VGARVGVLALQGDVREHLLALNELGSDPVEVRGPDDLTGVDGLILPGGESTTISLLLESSGLTDPLAERLASGMPAFGTCAGMIILATTVLDGRADQQPLGAVDIAVRRNAFGRQVDSFEADLAVTGVGDEPFHAVFIRAPLVEHAGPDVEVLASIPANATGEHPVACRQGPFLVTSFHPELSGDLRLHELFLKGF
jgi:5'-phosphate synthase pdxT subunit